MEPESYRQFIGIHGGGSFAAKAPSGIIGSADFAVTQNGTPNMSVNVAAGFAVVAGSNNVPVQGAYPLYNDGTVNVVVPTANATNPRIDVICLTVQDAFYSGATNTAIIQDIAGVPASSPTVPALPANSLALAHIYVGAAVSSILNANINTTAGTNNPDTIAFVPAVLPPGGIGSVAVTSSATIGTGATPLGLTVNVNVNANRRIKFSFFGQGSGSSTNLYSTWTLYRDSTSNIVGSFAAGFPAAGGVAIWSGVAYDQPAAGVHQYFIQAVTSAGTVSLSASATQPALLIVEDIGPAS